MVIGTCACSGEPEFNSDMKLFLRATDYAKKWQDRYPMGNGSFGVMEKGHKVRDEIGLNESSFWSGTGEDKHAKNPDGLAEARQKLNSGDISGAEETVKEKLLGGYTEGYLPLGNLIFERKKGGDNYERTLDLVKGVHSVSFGNTLVESFVSHPAGVYVRRETGANSAKIKFESDVRYDVEYTEWGIKVLLTAPSTVIPIYKFSLNPVRYDGDGGMRAFFCLKLKTDGTVTASGKGINISDYTELVWYAAASTEFSEGSDYIDNAISRVDKAALRSYDEVKGEHIADVESFMNRVTLSINGVEKSPDNTVTALKKGADESLIITLFQFGRYLSVAAQRGKYPANLQGIWNGEIRPKWSSNYTLNINTQMNLWGVDTLNLSECGDNLVDFVERLAARGKTVAKETFGLNGWTAGHNSDIWAHANPVGGEENGNPTEWAYYIGTAGWLCNMLYDRYRFNPSNDYLSRIRPLLAGSLEFYLDYATYDFSRGGYIFSPSVSPENKYKQSGKTYALTQETAMDNQIVAELCVDYLELSEILGADALTDKVKDFLAKLAPTKIGSDGRILEWGEEKTEAEVTHRHLSHLYLVYPGSRAVSPELRDAALKSLAKRGDDGTGWSLAWKVGLYARLRDGDYALKILERQLQRSTVLNRKGGSYDSLLGAHPPFQIDSNYGVAAGIAEMLVQSHKDNVEILPALPSAWKSGKITGLKIRGGQTVDISWANGKVVDVTYR